MSAVARLKDKNGKLFANVSIPYKDGKEYTIQINFPSLSAYNPRSTTSVTLTPKQAKILASCLLETCRGMEQKDPTTLERIEF